MNILTRIIAYLKRPNSLTAPCPNVHTLVQQQRKLLENRTEQAERPLFSPLFSAVNFNLQLKQKRTRERSEDKSFVPLWL